MTWRDSLVRFVMEMVAGKRPPASTLFPAHGQDGASSPRKKSSTRHCLSTFVRAKSSLSRKTCSPFAEVIVGDTAD